MNRWKWQTDNEICTCYENILSQVKERIVKDNHNIKKNKMPKILQASKGFTIFTFDKKKYIVSHTSCIDGGTFNEFYELLSNKSIIVIRSESTAESIMTFVKIITHGTNEI